MLAGLSSRRYGRAGARRAGGRDAGGRGHVKSAVSRRFVAATETALAELMTRRLDDLDLVAFMIDGVHFGEHTCVVALGIGIDGTKHPLAVEEGSTENATLVTGPDHRAARPRPGRHQAHPRRPRRRQGPVPRGQGRLRQAAHPKMPAAQDQKRQGQAAREGCAPSSSGGCARPTTPNPRSKAEGLLTAAGARAGQDPPRRRRLAARGHGRDADHPAPGRAAHPGPHPALDQPHRVHDRDLPGALQERQAVAGRDDGAALVRRRDARSRSPVPPRQRPPAPAETPRRARSALHQECQHRLPG